MKIIKNIKASNLFLLLLALLLFTACSGQQNLKESNDQQNLREIKDQKFPEYEVQAFSFKGHDAKIIIPPKPTKNKYWIWRARFWGHEPQVDIALLEKGFHVVYIDIANKFGNDEAVVLWNDFYKFCRSKYNLNKKVVLESMSRGALIAYNWASQNTDKVFSIYADAPVCDIKSWPGGMFENTALLAQKYKAAGGTIELIRKKGVGHHPHCLEDPKPIVDFILKSVKSNK